MESSFSTININDDEDQEAMVAEANQNSKLVNVSEEDLPVTSTSSKSSSPFNAAKHIQSKPSHDIVSISSKSSSNRNETDLSKRNENFYQTFSSLIMDQLNVPDVNALLDSQRNM
jgi:hypothetical protein